MNGETESVRQGEMGGLAAQNGNLKALLEIKKRLEKGPADPKPTPPAVPRKPRIRTERTVEDIPFKEGDIEDILFGGLEMSRRSGPHPTPEEERAEQALLAEKEEAKRAKKITESFDKREAMPPNGGMKEGQPVEETRHEKPSHESREAIHERARALIADTSSLQPEAKDHLRNLRRSIDKAEKAGRPATEIEALEARFGETVARIEHNLKSAERTPPPEARGKGTAPVKTEAGNRRQESPEVLSAREQLRRLKENQHDANMSDDLRRMVGEKIKQLEKELKKREGAETQTSEKSAALPKTEAPSPEREKRPASATKQGIRVNPEDNPRSHPISGEFEEVNPGRRSFLGLGKPPAKSAEASRGETKKSETAPEAPTRPNESAARRAETPRGAERKSVAPRTSALGWFMRQMPPGIQVAFLARQESAAREKREELQRTLSDREHLAQEFFADKKMLESRLETAGDEERREIQAELAVMTSEFEAKRNRDVREAQRNFETSRSAEQELTRQKETIAAQEVRKFADKLDALERRSMPFRMKLDRLTNEALRIRESSATASRRRLELLRDVHALGELKFWQVIKKWDRWQLNRKISKLGKVLEKNEKNLEKREKALEKTRGKLEPFEHTMAKLEEKRKRFAGHLRRDTQ